MADYIRLSFCIFVFLASLLAVFRAPLYLLWKLAVGVTEFPHLSIIFTLAVFFSRYFVHNFISQGDILSLGAVFIFSYPIISAYGTAQRVKILLNVKNSDFSFRFSKLFTGYGNKKIIPQTFIYKAYPDKDMKLDFYTAVSKQPSPCVIVVHGGSWARGDNSQLPQLNPHLANKGYHVAAINYRLAPEYTCPAPVEDVMDALNYLKSNSSKFNIDTSNFVLVGRSAGGQIALLTAYSKLIPELKGVISLYAPADMVWGWSLPGNPLVLDSRKVMKDFVGDTCENAPDKFAASSPIEFVSENSPPTLLIHGDNECMVAHEHSVRLSAKLKEKNIEHYLVTLPWGTHGCDYNLCGPTGQISTYAIEVFLRKTCKR